MYTFNLARRYVRMTYHDREKLEIVVVRSEPSPESRQ